VVRPFAWGLEFIRDHVNGVDPRLVFREHTAQAMAGSKDFYALPEITDWQLTDDVLTWTSVMKTPSPENNIARARLFPARRERKRKPRAAVLVLPQWNAQPDSHVEACRIFNGLGMTALRLTVPYHEERRPPELERAEHLVRSNIGRTNQSIRQAVLDKRAAVRLLQCQGFERLGLFGSSIGPCTRFSAIAPCAVIRLRGFQSVPG